MISIPIATLSVAMTIETDSQAQLCKTRNTGKNNNVKKNTYHLIPYRINHT